MTAEKEKGLKQSGTQPETLPRTALTSALCVSAGVTRRLCAVTVNLSQRRLLREQPEHGVQRWAAASPAADQTAAAVARRE